MNQTLFKPFEKYSEINLVTAGIISLIAGSFLGSYFGGRFDGIIDFHGHISTFTQTLTDNVVNTAVMTFLLFIAGKIINKRTRLIDLFTTALVARIPVYILPALSNNSMMESIESKINPANPAGMNFSAMEMALLLFIATVVICIVIWFIMLAYNGFKTAVNAKTTQHKVYFAIALIIAEIISKIVTTLY